MKTAIICYVCRKPKKFSDSYALKVVDYGVRIEHAVVRTTSKNAGEGGGGANSLPQVTKGLTFEMLKVRVCRPCTKRMGYKVKTVKKQNGKTI